MVKNYFLNVLADIAPLGLLASLHTIQEYRNPHPIVMTGLRI